MYDTVTIIIIFALFVALGGLAFWITRQSFGFGDIFQSKVRRLGVVETAGVDGRRRLVLVRRDDVEHLIMIGGPVDMVIETGIPAIMRVPNGLGDPLSRSDGGRAARHSYGDDDDAPLVMPREQHPN